MQLFIIFIYTTCWNVFDYTMLAINGIQTIVYAPIAFLKSTQKFQNIPGSTSFQQGRWDSIETWEWFYRLSFCDTCMHSWQTLHLAKLLTKSNRHKGKKELQPIFQIPRKLANRGVTKIIIVTCEVTGKNNNNTHKKYLRISARLQAAGCLRGC